MNFSYWEQSSFLSNIDAIVVGSGITGLVAAYHLKHKNPQKRVCVLERGGLPSGASTKNAGFACFGSAGELLEDVKTIGVEKTAELVALRKKGLDELLQLVGREQIELEVTQSFEVFSYSQISEYEYIASQMEGLNALVYPVFGKAVFSDATQQKSKLGLNGAAHLIAHKMEGLLHTGKMMQALIVKVKAIGVEIWNGWEVKGWHTEDKGIEVTTAQGKLGCRELFLATNAFTPRILNGLDVQPARNQVLLSQPIPGLKTKGAFHHQAGYVYFRNIGNRLLIGGARTIAGKEEETDQFGTTDKITSHLQQLAHSFTGLDLAWEQEWSGILGVGNSRETIVKSLENHVHAGVRLGGMGIAIGSLIGKRLAALSKLE